MLEISDLSLKYGKNLVLNHLSLNIGEGEIFGLLGPNGAGKTTLIKTIIGLLKADAGNIRLFGQYSPGDKPVRKLIGYMPQNHAIYPGLSILENILFFGHMNEMSNSVLLQRANEVLEMVELDTRKNDLVSDLSGGMVRRTMLATALIHQPRLLILDEPTVGVDPLLRIKFWDWFSQMVKEGTSIILTTHNIDEATHCQSVVFLRNGEKLAEGSPQALMQQYHSDSLESAFVAATQSKSEVQA